MPNQKLQAPALIFTAHRHPWLSLLLLPGLLSNAYASSDPSSITSVLPASSLSPITLVAQKLQNELILGEQRKRYTKAEKAFTDGQLGKFKRLTASLDNYPLQPYLEYKELTRRPASLSRQQITDFLQNHDDTVIGNRFRLKMIKQAAKKRNWQALLDVYRPGYGVTIECHYLKALIKTGQAALAVPSIENIWLSNKTQPKSCDSAFKYWETAGFKTPKIVWQRFKVAMSASNRRLAAYLIKSMPTRDASIARTWLKVHKKPDLITSRAILNLRHPEMSSILMHGLKRMGYKDIDKTINVYQQLNDYPFTTEQHAQIIRRIGLRLAREHMPDANIWLNRVPEAYTNKAVKEWRIRTAIRQADWSFVLKGISQLQIEEQANYRWQYWWAYANEQLGNSNDALGIYQYLADKRSYYGFLAADHLNQSYAFEDKPVEPAYEVTKSIESKPEALRAREFYKLGQFVNARREWHRLISQIDDEEKLAASKIAQSWNWHDRAIVTMGKTRYRDDIELRFPLHFVKKVRNWSTKHNIEPAWTYAIIRRESAFIQDARSPVGALGLMQLMPNTARHVARQLKIRYQGRHSLLASNTNIRLGTGYLESMLDKLDSQHVLATAAYNAGPHRVEKWLPEHHNMDAIRWIETIPFTETREYVSNVLAYMVIYEHRMASKITRLSQRMPQVQAKNPQLVISVGSAKEASQSTSTQSKDPG